MYIFALGYVCLYCWLGNELSEEVRKIVFSNHSRIYLSLYILQRKNILYNAIWLIRNFPSDIWQPVVSGNFCRPNEQSVSDIRINLRITLQFGNRTIFCVTRMSLIILSISVKTSWVGLKKLSCYKRVSSSEGKIN